MSVPVPSTPVQKIGRALRVHWFVLAALVVLVGDLAVTALDGWSSPRLLEAGIVFDLAVVIPALYLWCYRSRGKAAIVRAVALGCLGIWVAGHVVPDEHHRILGTVGLVRYVGLAVLLVIELKLVVAIYRAAFGEAKDAAPAALTAARDAGMPEWAARLMAWEAALGRKAWNAVRRLLGRRD